MKELANENAQLRSQPRHDDNEIEIHYTRVGFLFQKNEDLFKNKFLGKKKFTRTIKCLY